MNMKEILSYFIKGLLYLVPLAVTVYVLVAVIRFADSIFAGIPIVSHVAGLGLILFRVLGTVVG